MMLLVISAILASFALGVMIAYWLCSALFTVFRMHVQTRTRTPLPMQTKPAHL